MLRIVLIAVIFFFISCSKDIGKIPLPVKKVDVSSELKQWAYFKEGSYWIYKDSLTQTIDSVFVTLVERQTFSKENNDTNFIYESISIYFNSLKLYSRYALRSYPEDYIGFNDGYHHDHDMCIFLPSGINCSYHASKFITNQMVPSLIVDTTTFYDLRFINYHYCFGHNSAPCCPYADRVYWKKDIGIVKKSGGGVHGGRPELIRYHIQH